LIDSVQWAARTKGITLTEIEAREAITHAIAHIGKIKSVG